jgi:hypothetical protein
MLGRKALLIPMPSVNYKIVFPSRVTHVIHFLQLEVPQGTFSWLVLTRWYSYHFHLKKNDFPMWCRCSHQTPWILATSQSSFGPGISSWHHCPLHFIHGFPSLATYLSGRTGQGEWVGCPCVSLQLTVCGGHLCNKPRCFGTPPTVGNGSHVSLWRAR